jgi:hypothetical protein
LEEKIKRKEKEEEEKPAFLQAALIAPMGASSGHQACY